MVRFVLPIKVQSESNQREHFWTRYRRLKRQQEEVALLSPTNLDSLRPPLRIKLTRLWRTRHPRRMDDGNLAAAFKGVQDSLADCIGIDDGKIAWTYAQESNTTDQHAVRVEIEEDAT